MRTNQGLDKHILALCIGTFCLGVAELGIVPVLTDISVSLHVTIPQAGMYISAYAAGVCAGIVGLLLFARDADLRKTLSVAAVLIFLGNLGAACAINDWTMLAARFLSGSPHGIFFALSAVVAERMAKEGQASRDVTLMVLGQTTANLVGVPLGSLIGYALSWRLIFAAIAALSVLLFFALRYWLPALPMQAKPFKQEIRPLYRLQPWIILMGVAIGSGGFYAYYSYVDPIMDTISHLAPQNITYVIFVAGLAMFIGNVVSAPLTKRFSDTFLVLIGQGLIALAVIAAFFLSETLSFSVAAMAAAAFGYFFISGPMQALIIAGAGDSKVIIAALGQIAYNGANAIGSYLGSVAIDETGKANWSALPASILSVAATVLFLVVYLRAKHNNELR